MWGRRRLGRQRTKRWCERQWMRKKHSAISSQQSAKPRTVLPQRAQRARRKLLRRDGRMLNLCVCPEVMVSIEFGWALNHLGIRPSYPSPRKSGAVRELRESNLVHPKPTPIWDDLE